MRPKIAAEPRPRPFLASFRIGWWELVGAPNRAATLRWRCNNADQPRECNCGQPGTVCVTSGIGGLQGSEPPVWWRCDEHAGVPLTVLWSGGRPLIGQSRGAVLVEHQQY